jgi:hypothetical protein
MSIKILPNFAKVVRSFHEASRWLNAPQDALIAKLGREIRQEIINNMMKSPPPPLAASTIRRKGHGRSWFETGFMIRSALSAPAVRRPSSSKITLVIGVTKEIHPSAGIPTNELFSYLEYGTKSSPARPVILPIEMSIRNNAYDPLKTFKLKYIEELRKSLG